MVPQAPRLQQLSVHKAVQSFAVSDPEQNHSLALNTSGAEVKNNSGPTTTSLAAL